MTNRQKWLLRIAAVGGAILLVIVIAAIVTLRSAWFSNFVKQKIVAAAEDSTGAKVEIGSFDFDWSHLNVRIRNFVLHGTEPAGSAPLASVAVLELRLKLFSGFKKAVDLRYLGIDTPQVNLIVSPDGKTNVPEPKVKKKSAPRSTSPLETIVDLAVGEFRVDHGLLQFAQQKTAFGVRGENLRVLLDFNPASPSYQGSLSLDPLLVSSATHPPLRAHINVPIRIEKDLLRVDGARINTDASQILFTASLQNLNDPQITAQLNASVSLPEMQRSFALPIDVRSPRSPRQLTAQVSVQILGSNVIQIKAANVGLGQTGLQASGTMNPRTGSAADFHASFSLPELVSLFKVSGVDAAGTLDANGAAKLDGQNNYAVDGRLNTKNLFLRSGTTQIRNASLESPFHADPFLISLDGLRLNAFGGSIGAKLFIEKLEQLSVEASLRGFSLPVLASTFAGKPLGYDGVLGGSIKAQGNLNAKGTSGYRAQADLSIVPGNRGVPLSGHIAGSYNGSRGSVDLGQSYLAMPHSRLELAGSLDRNLDLHLLSRNLNDFLPAANFGSTKPTNTLPVALQNGGAASIDAHVKGKLAAPQIQSHVAVDRFAVEQRPFDHFALDLSASPNGAQITGGQLLRHGLQTNFDAAIGMVKFSPQPASSLIANVTIRNGDVADLLSLAGEGSVPATGNLNGDIHINGTYGNPLGNASVQVLNASAYGQPIDHVFANVNLADQLITLSTLELAAAQGRLNVNGTFRHPRSSFSVGHAEAHVRTTNIQLLNIQKLQQQSPGAAGAIDLSADMAGDLHPLGDQSEFNIANVTADLSAKSLRVQNQDAGDLTATARTNGSTVIYNAASNFAGSTVKVNGKTTLAPNYPTNADAAIQNLSVEKVLAILGQGSVPASGNLSADAHVAGTLQAPDANLQFALTKANVYEEPIDRLLGSVHYTDTSVTIPSIQLDVPAGSLGLHGAFQHPSGNFSVGTVTLKLDSTPIQVAKIRHATQAKAGLDGVIKLAADLAGDLKQQQGRSILLFSHLNADASADELRVGSMPLGRVNFGAKTAGQQLDFRFDSELAKSQIHAAGRSQLTGDYQTSAQASFTNIRYENLAPFLETDNTEPASLNALVEGNASFNGPVLRSDDLVAKLQLDRLEVRSAPRGSPTGAPPSRIVAFHNEGPIQLAYDHSIVSIKHLDIEGPKTSIKASGGMNLKNDRSPLAVDLKANADLTVLQDTNRDFYSSGTVALDTMIRGTLAQPLVNGQVELKNANINHADSPNGLSNANGVILLNGTSATIQNLTGESGGGKVAVSGFAGYNSRAVNFNLRLTANRVRARSSGVSITSDADISLTGNTRRSLASGQISIRKIAYGSSSDAGSFLSTASTPPVTPSVPSPLLAGMRLDVHIVTAPDLRVVTTYADRLAIEANLSVRGTAATPGVIGRVSVTDGQLVFFGNQYTVNTGTINFYNPTAIQPILNFSLETIAQNVDVVLGVSGPMNNLALTYRSDPPLTFQQIVSLLATNTTPNDPTIAARQPAPPQQSLAQMGSSAVLGQAVANPLASRVQRVFGLSAFKIDPSVAGSNGQPTAKVTLQQKISSNVTFTYITDVTQTNSQIIRVEWAFTPKLSAVALRDFNGNVSVQFFYKFKMQ